MADLKEIQHQLEISETKFRKLFEMAQDGIILIDPITENIIDVNPYLLDLIGYAKVEIVGKKLWDLGIFPEDVKKNKLAFDKLQTEGYVRYENLPLQNKSGKAMQVEFVSNLYPIDGTKMIQCNIRDITARKKAEVAAQSYLAEIERTNKLLAERQASMIDIGNTMNLSDKERINKIMESYAEGLEAIGKLIQDLKTKNSP